MTLSRDYAAFVEDILSPLGSVRVRPMFGGAGVFRDGVMFALISDDTLYLKADEALARELAADGSEKFVYEAKTRRMEMPYWRLPERFLDEPDELAVLAARSLAIARSTAGGRKPRRRGG